VCDSQHSVRSECVLRPGGGREPASVGAGEDADARQPDGGADCRQTRCGPRWVIRLACGADPVSQRQDGCGVGRLASPGHARREPRQAPVGNAVLAPAVATADKAEADKQVQLPFALQFKRPNQSRLEIEFAGKTAIHLYNGTQG
jgi:hypothetical protein